MKIKLSDHFTYKKLLRFVLSPILMMVFTSIYSVVDGFFVSNFTGDDAFTGLNIIFPFIMALGAFGFMLGAGGTAIVSKTLGEENKPDANRYFTFLTAFTFGFGVVLAVLGIAFIRPVATLLGAEGQVHTYAVQYGTVVLSALPFFMLQNAFQSFFIAAERAKTGFKVTVASGLTNIVLDALFVAVFKWDLVGAATATAIAQVVGGVVPVVYFMRKNRSILQFVKTKWYGKVLVKSCTNGASELLGNISMSLVTMIYNAQLLKMAGNDGVDAFGVVAYVQFVFVAIFIGYCIGVAPIVGYNFGAQNKKELQNVFAKSMVILSVTSVCMIVLGIGMAKIVATAFVSDDQVVLQMATRAMRLYSISFVFVGFNMFSSSFFTALNNGVVSAVISFGRTLVFQLLCIYFLPLLLNLDGIWLATPLAELLSVVLSFAMFFAFGKKYGYLKGKKERLPVDLAQDVN